MDYGVDTTAKVEKSNVKSYPCLFYTLVCAIIILWDLAYYVDE